MNLRIFFCLFQTCEQFHDRSYLNLDFCNSAVVVRGSGNYNELDLQVQEPTDVICSETRTQYLKCINSPFVSPHTTSTEN